MTSYTYSLIKDFPEPHQVDQDFLIASIRANVQITTPICEFGVDGDVVLIGFIQALSNEEITSLDQLINTYVYSDPVIIDETLPNNYFFAYDTTSQIKSAASFGDITFNTNGSFDGWTHKAGTANFLCGQTGSYQFTYTAMLNSSVTNNTITIVATDGSNNQIVGSQTNARVTTSAIQCVSNTFQATINTGNIIKLRFYPTGSNGIINSGGNATPKTSIQFSCRRIN